MGTITFLADLKPELTELELNLRNGDRPKICETLKRLEGLAIHQEDTQPTTVFNFTPNQVEDIHIRTGILRLAQSLLALADREPDPAAADTT